jgi:hypothetical protein
MVKFHVGAHAAILKGAVNGEYACGYGNGVGDTGMGELDETSQISSD